MSATAVIDTTVTDEDLRALIEEEERRSGLRPDGNVDAVEIERRRVQISFLGLLVVGAVLGLCAIRVFNDDTHVWVGNESLATMIMAFLAGVFAVYAIDKDRHLKRLLILGEHLLAVERRAAARVLERAAFSVDELALHRTLALDPTTNELARRVLAAVDGAEVAVHLGDETGLHGAASRARTGSPVGLRAPRSVAEAVLVSGESVAMRVDDAWTDRPDAFGSVVCARLGDDASVPGVVVVASGAGRSFTADEIEWITGYARHAATAVRNAQLFEAALLRAEYLGQRTVATMADELGLVAGAIGEVATRLADPATPAPERGLLLDGLRRTGERIAAMTDRAREHLGVPL